MRGRDEPPPRVAPTLSHPDDERRILVIANETVAGDTLHAMIKQKSEGYRENVLVVAPAQPSPLQHLASDEDPGAHEAQAAARREPGEAPRGGDLGARRGRRRRSAAGDRGRAADVRPRRDHHLDASRGAVALARARRRRDARASASPCRSRTSSSTSSAHRERGSLAPPTRWPSSSESVASFSGSSE